MSAQDGFVEVRESHGVPPPSDNRDHLVFKFNPESGDVEIKSTRKIMFLYKPHQKQAELEVHERPRRMYDLAQFGNGDS